MRCLLLQIPNLALPVALSLSLCLNHKDATVPLNRDNGAHSLLTDLSRPRGTMSRTKRKVTGASVQGPQNREMKGTAKLLSSAAATSNQSVPP